MVDNISFVDEVNLNNNNNNNNNHYHNNSNSKINNSTVNSSSYPTYGSNQQPFPKSTQSSKRDDSPPAAAAVTPITGFYRGSDTRDVSWMTRSVTQPNLKTSSAFVASPPIGTQSEESVLARGNCTQIGRIIANFPYPWEPNALPSSHPVSYEELSSGAVSCEYLDARSSFSAPVELLSEFLSALMSRDYQTALNLCQSILRYEPNNATALEFYPLLKTKIKQRNPNDHGGITDDDDYDDDVTDTDATSDAFETTDNDDDDDDDANGNGEGGLNVKRKKVPEDRKEITSKILRHKTRGISVPAIAGDDKDGLGDVTTMPNMSASSSTDFSAIDSGRESLLSPNDSDFTIESSDSLYSSTDSNLNMIRSGSDSLFSSTEMGLKLESVVHTMEKLGVGGK